MDATDLQTSVDILTVEARETTKEQLLEKLNSELNLKLNGKSGNLIAVCSVIVSH